MLCALERKAYSVVVTVAPPPSCSNVTPVVSFGWGSLWNTTVSNAGGSGHQLPPATCFTVAAETSAARSASAVSGVAASGVAAALAADTSSASASSPARMVLAGDHGAQRLAERLRRREHGGRLVAAVCHAVVAARVASAPVLRPVGRLDQLAVGLRVAVRHQVARALPAEERVARDPPRRALEVDLAFEKVEEERRVVQPPALPIPVAERLGEQLPGL